MKDFIVLHSFISSLFKSYWKCYIRTYSRLKKSCKFEVTAVNHQISTPEVNQSDLKTSPLSSFDTHKHPGLKTR